MTTLKVGIASYDEMKARTMAVARGERRVAANEPKVWFTSTESFAKLLSAGNRALLRVIVEKTPGSLDQLARITGKAKSNLSRTLRAMEGYGLVHLERGERGRITPKVMHDRVELHLQLSLDLADVSSLAMPDMAELRREAYDAGYAAALQAIREFATRPAAAATAEPRRHEPTPSRTRREDNVWHIVQAMMTLPNHTGPAAAIKKALAGEGHDLPYSSIRHWLDQLQTRGEVSVAADGRTWSYTAPRLQPD